MLQNLRNSVFYKWFHCQQYSPAQFVDALFYVLASVWFIRLLSLVLNAVF
jgi:hypothetical protein